MLAFRRKLWFRVLESKQYLHRCRYSNTLILNTLARCHSPNENSLHSSNVRTTRRTRVVTWTLAHLHVQICTWVHAVNHVQICFSLNRTTSWREGKHRPNGSRFISSWEIISATVMPFITGAVCVYREAAGDRTQGKKVQTAVKKL